MLIASLREVIKNQAQELEMLQKQVKDLSSVNSDVSVGFFLFIFDLLADFTFVLPAGRIAITSDVLNRAAPQL